MKNSFNIIITTIILLIVASCSNDFLNENLDKPVVPAGESGIYISPEWESGDYQFYLPDMGNADFKIEAMPSWLQISSTSGKLVNSMASIHCSVTKNSGFENIGIYLDKMEVTAGGQTFYVPVAYITEGNPTIQVERTLTVNDNPYLQIYNSGAGILVWDVISLPDWLSIDMDRFNEINPAGVIVPQYSYAQLPLTFDLNTVFDKDLTGTIILKTNDKSNSTVEIKVTVDLGNPEISIWLYDNKIDFGSDGTTYSLEISAWGSGLLVWQFEELPDWLTVTPSKGIYNTHTYYGNIVFTCDRTKLQPGINSSVIYLKSNAYNNPSMAITVTARAPGDNSNIWALEGNIADVAFDKNTNTLYYVTSQPDKLVAYDVVKRSVLRELQLSKAPTCLAVSEDWAKAAIGHGGRISAVNLENWSISNTIDINGTLFDIAWSEDDWFCYSIASYDSSYELYWVNTNSGENYGNYDGHMYYGTIIKKVPTQPYLIASRQNLWPSGFIAYSASTKSLKSYAHMELRNFWFSQDGQYTFGTDGNIYRTSSATDSNDTFDATINSIGQFRSASGEYFSAGWIEHSSSAHRIWAIDEYYYSDSGYPAIYQFEDTNYTYQKSYFYSDIYQPDTQTTAYEVEAQYLFSNKEDTELSVLRKGRNNDNWSIEFIPITP